MPVHGPSVSAKHLMALRAVVGSPFYSVAWLASLTADEVIVTKLGGLGDRLARHCLWLVGNLQNEAGGIEVAVGDRTQPSTARAVRAHTLGAIFEEYPTTANYVLDGVVALTLEAYLAANPSFVAEDLAGLDDDLNYFALRHGIPSQWADVDERRERFGRYLESHTPFADGPQVFWDVALSSMVLRALNLPASQGSVMAVIGLLQAHAKFSELFAPYVLEGRRRHEALAAGTN